jgi:hypothetical protein
LSRNGRKILANLAKLRDGQIEADAIAKAERETRENSPHYKLALISANNLAKLAAATGVDDFQARANELLEYASDGRLPEKVKTLDSSLQSDILAHAEQLRATSALGKLQATQAMVQADELARLAEDAAEASTPPDTE